MELQKIEQVAVALGRSFQSIRNAIASGELAVVRVGARGIRVRQEDVEKYLARAAAARKPPASQNETRIEVPK